MARKWVTVEREGDGGQATMVVRCAVCDEELARVPNSVQSGLWSGQRYSIRGFLRRIRDEAVKRELSRILYRHAREAHGARERASVSVMGIENYWSKGHRLYVVSPGGSKTYSIWCELLTEFPGYDYNDRITGKICVTKQSVLLVLDDGSMKEMVSLRGDPARGMVDAARKSELFMEALRQLNRYRDYLEWWAGVLRGRPQIAERFERFVRGVVGIGWLLGARR